MINGTAFAGYNTLYNANECLSSHKKLNLNASGLLNEWYELNKGQCIYSTYYITNLNDRFENLVTYSCFSKDNFVIVAFSNQYEDTLDNWSILYNDNGIIKSSNCVKHVLDNNNVLSIAFEDENLYRAVLNNYNNVLAVVDTNPYRDYQLIFKIISS